MNYKDGLAISGKGKIARRMPMVGGVDLSGTVVESRSPDWKLGDKVIVNGWGLSETEWGGYARYQRLKPEWLIRLPDAFSLQQAMAIAPQAIRRRSAWMLLEKWMLSNPARRGAGDRGCGWGWLHCHRLAGGLWLSRHCVDGRPETHDYLASLGASSFIDRATLAEKGAPLQKERWTGGVDSVGSTTLVNALSQTVRGGHCRLWSGRGADLPGTVMPHILRSVTLIGVDSVQAPLAQRLSAWERLARDLDVSTLDSMTTVEPMSNLPALADAILAGKIRGGW